MSGDVVKSRSGDKCIPSRPDAQHQRQTTSHSNDRQLKMVDVAMSSPKPEEALRADDEERADDEDESSAEEGELPEEGEICEDEDDTEGKAQTSSPRRSPPTVPDDKEPRKVPAKYKDYDPKPTASDPSNAMLNSWVNGVKQKSRPIAQSTKPIVDTNATPFDPNDEYYGYEPASSPTTIPGGDKDYRSVGGAEPVASDKDYRYASNQPGGSPDGRSPPPRNGRANEFGDLDYRSADTDERRPVRKRRPSSPEMPLDENGRRIRPEDGEKRARRSPPSTSGPAPAPLRRVAIRGSRWGDRMTICKFFREGYCRDGEHCAFSHDAMDSLRRPELCKYYQQGYCKKGLQCPMLHGEFPCKAFHKGECSKEHCQYSHTVLTAFTRPIFDQMIKDEELTSRIHIPTVPSKRKVLLPGGPMMPPSYAVMPPSNGSMPEQRQSSAFDNLPPVVPSPHSIGLLPPPTLTVPQLVTSVQYAVQVQADNPAYAPLPQLPYPLMPPPIVQPQQGQSPSYPPRDTDCRPQFQAKKEEPKEEVEEAPKSFNINKMLEEITQKVKDDDLDEIEESPASPPMLPEASIEAPTIPQIVRPNWRLAPCFIPFAPNSNLPRDILQFARVDLQFAINDSKLRNDPRIKKLLSSQFDAVSTMLSSKSATMPVKEEAIARPADPRLSRDPRKKAAASSVPMPISTQPTVQSRKEDDQIQHMIEMQLQMMNHQQSTQSSSLPGMGQSQSGLLPTPVSTQIYAPINSSAHPPPMTVPMAMPPLPMLSDIGLPSLSDFGDPMTGSSGGGWMPQLSGGLSGSSPDHGGISSSQLPSYVPPPAIGRVSNPMLGAFNRDRDDEDLMRMDGGGRSMLVNDSPLYDDYGSSSPENEQLSAVNMQQEVLEMSRLQLNKKKLSMDSTVEDQHHHPQFKTKRSVDSTTTVGLLPFVEMSDKCLNVHFTDHFHRSASTIGRRSSCPDMQRNIYSRKVWSGNEPRCRRENVIKIGRGSSDVHFDIDEVEEEHEHHHQQEQQHHHPQQASCR